MTSDLLTSLGVANLAAAAAILIVLALRGRARSLLGARTAYALWLIVPAAMLATLAPARSILVPAAPPMAVALEPTQVLTPAALAAPIASGPALDLSQLALAVWLTGVAVSLILLAIGQRRALSRFGPITADPEDPRLARAANPEVGPALVGFLRPRVIVPADFETRFDAGERAMILAHERIHLSGGDTAVNALVALMRAVNWFNPLVHLAARCARVDQELACDAAVVRRFPGERRSYAEALLKTQLATVPLPLGCDWPVRSQSLLEERIEMLALPSPGRARLAFGAAFVAALTLSAGLAAWSAEPPVVKAVAAPDPAPAAAIASGDMREALKLGATARDIGGMLKARGQDIDPNSAVWVKGAGAAFSLAYTRSGDKQQGSLMLREFMGYEPPGGVASLPTLEEALGAPPPPLPPTAKQLAARRMFLGGGSPQDVAKALTDDGRLPAPFVGYPPIVLDIATARFIRLQKNAGVGVAFVPRGGGRMVLSLPDTASYSGLAKLPTLEEAFPLPNPPRSGQAAPQTKPIAATTLSPQVQAIRDSVQAAIDKERARQAALPAPKDDAERILRMRDLQMAGINVLAKVDFTAFPLAERQASMIASSAPFTALSAENQAALLKLVPAEGWFSSTTYGDRAVRASISLARNFDLATQEALLRRLESLAKAKAISGDSYGFLFDQVAIDKREAQRYGTAVRCDGGKFRPYPMEDPEHVEERRQSVGFTTTYAETLKVYREQPACLQSPMPPPSGMRLD